MFAARRCPSDISSKTEGKNPKEFWSAESTSTAASLGDLYGDQSSLSDWSSDAWMSMALAQKMPPPPQHFKKVIETAVTANRPTDFASAWNAAANVSGWKRKEPSPHANKMRPRKGAAKKAGDRMTAAPKMTATPTAARNVQQGIAPRFDDQQYAEAEDKFDCFGRPVHFLSSQAACRQDSRFYHSEADDCRQLCNDAQRFDIPLPKFGANKATPPVARNAYPTMPARSSFNSPAELTGVQCREAPRMGAGQGGYTSDVAFGFAAGHGESSQQSYEGSSDSHGFYHMPMKIDLARYPYNSLSL
jgi:hypothetical protein